MNAEEVVLEVGLVRQRGIDAVGECDKVAIEATYDDAGGRGV